MNSTILYLIRHGTTIYNKKGIFQGSMDVPLGKQGLFQADCLAERMKNIPMDAVYSSPLKRAYKTAQKLADATNSEVVAVIGRKMIFWRRNKTNPKIVIKRKKGTKRD